MSAEPKDLKSDKYKRLCEEYAEEISIADNPCVRMRVKIAGEVVHGFLNTETGKCVDKLGNVLIQAHRTI